MPSVRVTCPECAADFTLSDRVVGGLVACRFCRAEFRVEFDDAPEPPPPRPRERRDSRPMTDEPEGWTNDLPVRSPMPIIIGLVAVQVVVGLLLALNWAFPAVFTHSTAPATYKSRDSADPPRTKPSARL